MWNLSHTTQDRQGDVDEREQSRLQTERNENTGSDKTVFYTLPVARGHAKRLRLQGWPPPALSSSRAAMGVQCVSV